LKSLIRFCVMKNLAILRIGIVMIRSESVKFRTNFGVDFRLVEEMNLSLTLVVWISVIIQDYSR